MQKAENQARAHSKKVLEAKVDSGNPVVGDEPKGMHAEVHYPPCFDIRSKGLLLHSTAHHRAVQRSGAKWGRGELQNCNLKAWKGTVVCTTLEDVAGGRVLCTTLDDVQGGRGSSTLQHRAEQRK